MMSTSAMQGGHNETALGTVYTSAIPLWKRPSEINALQVCYYLQVENETKNCSLTGNARW